MGIAKPRGKGRVEEISLDSVARHLLEECRMVIPGIQALFGFQLIAVFSQGFGDKLAPHAQYLHVGALAIGIDAYVVTSAVLHNDVVAAALAAALLGVFAALWLLLPRRERSRQEPGRPG